MISPRILVVQPDPTVPIGSLDAWLTEQGAALDTRRPPDDDLPENLENWDGLLVLGGTMRAGDAPGHPWLSSVRGLLSAAVAGDVPTLGICLGAQLLAVTAGGRVGADPRGPDVGPALVSKKDAAWVDPLFSDLPLMQDVLQFREDTIEQLPAGAELLASSPRAANQAYRLRRRVYGIQFHIETTPEVVSRWASDAPEKAATARPGALDEDNLARVHTDIAETWRTFAHRFADLAASRIDPVETRYTLPMA
ncbi:type 1 glutamine amidotransferase [Saccharomonospora halophila]|uniref:type 1 glutamine amidotransferase n=1 Tax=Saccharomonospora halophila TaxID=129922 RepID=UPI00048E47D7|nr:type 1 glutamine amidotransferase [Saccharomonospora halophila]